MLPEVNAVPNNQYALLNVQREEDGTMVFQPILMYTHKDGEMQNGTTVSELLRVAICCMADESYKLDSNKARILKQLNEIRDELSKEDTIHYPLFNGKRLSSEQIEQFESIKEKALNVINMAREEGWKDDVVAYNIATVIIK